MGFFDRGYEIAEQSESKTDESSKFVIRGKGYDLVLDPNPIARCFQVFYRCSTSDFSGLVTARDWKDEYPTELTKKGLSENDIVLDIGTGLSDFGESAATICTSHIPVLIDIANYSQLILLAKAALDLIPKYKKKNLKSFEEPIEEVLRRAMYISDPNNKNIFY